MWLRPWSMQVPTIWRASEAPEAPKPEFDPNSIFQSLSNLTSGGHTGNLYSNLERFGDVLGFVGDGFLKKWFFDRKFFIFFPEFFLIFQKIWKKSRKSDFRKFDFWSENFHIFPKKNRFFFGRNRFFSFFDGWLRASLGTSGTTLEVFWTRKTDSGC